MPSRPFLLLWPRKWRDNSPATGFITKTTKSWDALSCEIGEIDTNFDHQLLEIMREGKSKALADYSLEQLLQAGDSEFLNWMVVLGTVGDAKAASTAYMPDHVATGW